jgi:hypothetical protein
MGAIRRAFAGASVAVVALAACSGHPGPSGGSSASPVGTTPTTAGNTGSVGMHLTVPPGVHIDSLNWRITNGIYPYTGVVGLTDDAGNEAQSIEFVAGGILAGPGYTVTLYGADSSGDPCSGTSAPVTVSPGATSAAVVLVTCTVPTDAAVATQVDSGNLAVDAGVVLVNQAPFVCPGITGVSISPAEVMAPESAALTATSTSGGGGTATLLWTATGGTIDNPTSPSATFHCNGGGQVATVTLTVGLLGTGADGGSVGQVCSGVANTTITHDVVCEGELPFQCLNPLLPTVCSTDAGSTCVNLTNDANNCGSCGRVCPLGFSCTQSHCGDALSACTTFPCAAAGPNSVHCDGNTAAAHLNVCTPTEAAIVAQDIAAHNLTASNQLDSASSCYECLVNVGGLDDDLFASDKGNECGDVAASAPTLNNENGQQACLDTLNCLIANSLVTTNPPSSAWCGTASVSVCATTPGAANGLCISQETNGLDSTTPSSVAENYVTKTFPSGMANALAGFAFTNCAAQCSPKL